jgi:hypothetical protein
MSGAHLASILLTALSEQKEQKMPSNEFNFTPPEVDSSLYLDDIESLPMITWHGRMYGDGGMGFWASTTEDMPEPPSDLWQPTELRFGTNPNAPAVPGFKALRLRAAFIGWRRRWVVEEVMVQLHGENVIRMLALRGYTKGVCWDNEPATSRGNREFPIGVMQIVKGYAATATANLRETGAVMEDLPWLCTFWVDLLPWRDATGNVANSVQVGGSGGVWMNPFVADMAVGDSLPTRFVGTENFERLQTTRREIGIPWEEDWDTIIDEEQEQPYTGDTSGIAEGDRATERAADIPF